MEEIKLVAKGMEGSGKTEILTICKEALESKGHKVSKIYDEPINKRRVEFIVINGTLDEERDKGV